MRLIKTLLLFLLFCGVLIPAMALNEWTVMLYLVSDDNDSPAMMKAHLEMINSLPKIACIPQKYEVVIQVDAPKGYALVSSAKNKDGGFRLEPGQNKKWNAVQELGEVNMGSPYCLWDFLKWATQKHPAKRYALFVAGHGSGIFSWRGEGNVSSSKPGKVDFDPDRFVGYDDSDDDCLTIFEMQAVFDAFKRKLNNGRPLDVMALDSCMPGAIEALYQFRDVIKIMASSPSTTLIGGMPYFKIIATLAENCAINEEQFGEMVAKSYVQNKANAREEGEVMGVYRPAEAKAMVGSIDQLSIELLRAQQAGGRLSFKNLTAYGGKRRYWDLGRILRSLDDGSTSLSGVSQPERIKTLVGEAIEALKASRVTTWYSGGHADQKVSGISIAWPEKEEYLKWRAFYEALEFARDSHWDEFLDARMEVK